MQMSEKLSVIGGGAWATALASLGVRNNLETSLWTRNTKVAETLNDSNENPLYLPDVALPTGIAATTDLSIVLEGASTVLLVTPAQSVREVSASIRPHLAAGIPVAICAKGIDCQKLEFLSGIVEENLPDNPVAVLSGPNFASEVARGLPAAAVVAANDPEAGRKITDTIGSKTFRPYLSSDRIGVELGGAVKNVLAIACGIVAGKGLGENAKAALITRGLSEMARLVTVNGGRLETVMGLSGVGDLVLTCSSLQSRNMSLGYGLGQGKSLDEILGPRRAVTEGVRTADAVRRIAERDKLDLPICLAVDAILTGRVGIDEAIGGLLARPFRDESAI